jgi:AraC-like DNA-binding protein
MALVFPGQEVSFNEPCSVFARHHHLGAYAALIVRGECDEAGDRGRYRVGLCDVLVHRAFDGHRNSIGTAGATIVNIPLRSGKGVSWGQVIDLDAVIRAFERDPVEGTAEFHAQFTPRKLRPGDWPDLLADALAANPRMSLRAWGYSHGVHPASLSRGFRLAYGLTPKRFRVERLASRAARRLRSSKVALSQVAAEVGFSDQAHMTRAIRHMFGMTPGALRQVG